MTSLRAVLEANEYDSDATYQAARYFVAELSDDLIPAKMRDELVRELGKPQVDLILGKLRYDGLLLENASLLLLSEAWEDPSDRAVVLRLLADSKGKLPIVEAGLLAITVMYGLYLLATGGRKRIERTLERRPDGSFVEREITEFTSPNEPMSVISRLLGIGARLPQATEAGVDRKEITVVDDALDR